MKFALTARHGSPRPKTRVQSSPVRRSYPGGRRVAEGRIAEGRTEYETLHVDGIATVELDVDGLEQLVYRAILNRTKRAKTGALSVTFFGGVVSTWTIIRPGTEAAIDRATCEALIVAEVLRERMRLTGRLNPPPFLDPAPAPQHRDHGVAP